MSTMAKIKIPSSVLTETTLSFSHPLEQDDFRRTIPSERNERPAEPSVHIESLSVLTVMAMRAPSASIWKPKGME